MKVRPTPPRLTNKRMMLILAMILRFPPRSPVVEVGLAMVVVEAAPVGVAGERQSQRPFPLTWRIQRQRLKRWNLPVPRKASTPEPRTEEKARPAEGEAKAKAQKTTKCAKSKQKKIEASNDEQHDSKVAATPLGDGADAVKPEKHEQTTKTPKRKAEAKSEAKAKAKTKQTAAKAKAKTQKSAEEKKEGAGDQPGEEPTTFAGRYCAQTEPARSKWLAIRDVFNNKIKPRYTATSKLQDGLLKITSYHIYVFKFDSWSVFHF